MIYLLVKSLHICSVIFWIGGMLLQCILLVSGRSLPGPSMPVEVSSLKMLHRWQRAITGPAMILTWLSGLFIATQGGWFGSHWLSLKLALVFVLSAMHGSLTGLLRRRIHSTSRQTSTLFSFALPGLFIVTAAIVLLVITKPF